MPPPAPKGGAGLWLISNSFLGLLLSEKPAPPHRGGGGGAAANLPICCKFQTVFSNVSKGNLSLIVNKADLNVAVSVEFVGDV